jgi:hypothetical protein
VQKIMGIYCKAYQLSQLRAYSKWSENAAAARQVASADGSGNAPRALSDSDIVYVQENHVVTDGIFKDENVLFDAVDAEWIAFCEGRLGFAIPEDVIRASQAEAA